MWRYINTLPFVFPFLYMAFLCFRTTSFRTIWRSYRNRRWLWRHCTLYREWNHRRRDSWGAENTDITQQDTKQILESWEKPEWCRNSWIFRLISCFRVATAVDLSPQSKHIGSGFDLCGHRLSWWLLIAGQSAGHGSHQLNTRGAIFARYCQSISGQRFVANLTRLSRQ